MKQRSVIDTRLQPMISGFIWGLSAGLLLVVAAPICSRYARQPATAAQPLPRSSGVPSPIDRIVVI